jgi:hypothetical protein
MPDISMSQIQAARGMQDQIDAMGDRDYIKTICNTIIKMLDNPATSNLDLSTARTLCQDFAEQIEADLERNADQLDFDGANNQDVPAEEPVADETPVAEDELDFEVDESYTPSLKEAKDILRKHGYIFG